MSLPAATVSTPAEPVGARVRVGNPVYNEIVEFLYDEAAFLDQLRFAEWASLLAEDLVYTAPLRVTRTGPDQSGSIVRTTKHFDDDYPSIMIRLGRLKTKSAWAEDPPSRTRRYVSNVRVNETPTPDEYAVVSYLLLARSRYEDPELQQMSAERHDVLRRTTTGFKLARREILIDQTTVGMQNFAIFF